MPPPAGPSRPRRRHPPHEGALTALSTIETRPAALGESAVAALGGPVWLRDRRLEAHARFASRPLPTLAEEIWRYSRIDQLDLGRYAPVPPAAPVSMPLLPPAAQALVDRVGDRGGFALTVDGVVAEADLSDEAERAGARLATFGHHPDAADLVGEVEAHFAEAEEDEPDALFDLACSFVADGVVLTVPARERLSAPIVLVHLVTGGSGPVPLVAPRTVVVLGESAEASVIELVVSGEEEALVLPVVELTAGDNARLTYSAVQQLGRSGWQLGRLFARAGRDASLSAFTASLGGGYARSRTDSVLDGTGGSAELLAAFLGDGTQMHDFRTVQEHRAARTTSDLVVKGAVGGSSRSVYSGMIRMKRGARGANAFQTNRNLVLSPEAHADSVPNLDIEENDVRCSHASAVGPIDESQLFYLESRGVPRAAAERLIVLGFFEELAARVQPAVRAHLAASVSSRVRALTEAESS